MAAIDMPANPENPSTYKASNGVTYAWDGTKWTATSGADEISTGIRIGETPGQGPYEPGNLWYNTVDGILYVWYSDVDQNPLLGEGQWVDTRPGND